MSDYETIIANREGRVQVIQLNRPKALNALNAKLIAEVLHVCQAADADEGVGCILIKGSEKAFAAGADIKEMLPKGFIDVVRALERPQGAPHPALTEDGPHRRRQTS